jgi:hypothetical protein
MFNRLKTLLYRHCWDCFYCTFSHLLFVRERWGRLSQQSWDFYRMVLLACVGWYVLSTDSDFDHRSVVVVLERYLLWKSRVNPFFFIQILGMVIISDPFCKLAASYSRRTGTHPYIRELTIMRILWHRCAASTHLRSTKMGTHNLV